MFNKKFLSNSQSGALDIIVVKQSDDTLLCSGFHVRFGCMQTVNSEAKVEILINNQLIDSVTMEVGLDGEAYFKSYHYKNLKKIKKKSLRMNNDQLQLLKLKQGPNKIKFKIMESEQYLESYIFLYDLTQRFFISDIDGTITKSDVMGQTMNMLKMDYSHEDIVELFNKFDQNQIQVIYLTARPIYQYDHTRSYLSIVKQHNCNLPFGPLLMSPDDYMLSIKREIIHKTPYILKTNLLTELKNLFPQQQPFLCGFGNRDSDAIAYRMINIPLNQIYIVNKQSQIVNLNDLNFILTYKILSNSFQTYFPF